MREATTSTARHYKDAIRRYLESFGYTLTLDSDVEGVPIDMVFQSMLPGGSSIWVEAKNSEIGSTDADLRREILGYLADWLKMPFGERFEMRIFIKRTKNPSRWDEVFGSDMVPSTIHKWVQDGLDKENVPIVNESLSKDPISVEDFFRRTIVFEGDVTELEWATEQKDAVLPTGIRKYAQRELDEMKIRCGVGCKKDRLITNLVQMEIPPSFCILEVESSSKGELIDALRNEEVLPSAVISRSRILTLDVPNVSKSFNFLNLKSTSKKDRKEVERYYSYELSILLNRCIDDIVKAKGARNLRGHTYFFPLKVQNGEVNPFKIPNRSGREVTVATPFNKILEEEIGEAEEFELTIPPEQKQQLNFGFHKGAVVETRELWGGHFVSIKIKKVYTTDGENPVDSKDVPAIDAFFRNPRYNRSEAQFRIIGALKHFLFNTNMLDLPDWARQFRFKDLLELETNYSPVLVKPGQFTLDVEYEPSVGGSEAH